MKSKYLDENLLESIIDEISTDTNEANIFSQDTFVSPVKKRNSDLLMSFATRNQQRSFSLWNNTPFEFVDEYIINDLEKVAKITEVLWLLLWYSNFSSAIDRIKKNGK